jgi:ribosomal protein L25 (general stress protein Ctc)
MDRSRILLEIEGTLSKLKAEELNANSMEKMLSENSQLLINTEKDYVVQVKELSVKRDSEIQRLTNRANELERQVKSQEEENKRKIIKKKTDDKIPQIMYDLKSAKSQLQVVQQDFAAQQEKLEKDYEKRKQELTLQIENLRKQLNALGGDQSYVVRQASCQALSSIVDAFIQRTA